MRFSVRTALATTAALLAAHSANAQVGVGASLTPYAGYFVAGNWYDGPVGTSLSTTNAPMVGAQASFPLTGALRSWVIWRTPPAIFA